MTHLSSHSRNTLLDSCIIDKLVRLKGVHLAGVLLLLGTLELFRIMTYIELFPGVYFQKDVAI